ncbi:MAG: type I-C CRISPR-associated protein Cas8c/Csd1, partial [Endomicrobium sp.]|nr:type I-C CRISPR-associated protein Cas8c/Csd1 [Endomicrobium sp.]
MSWFQKLYESYDNCRKASESSGYNKILPIYHSMRDSHIEITIDGEGNFKEAKFKLEKETIIQTTEKSASRTSNDLPHGLADEIQYIAKDYAEGVAPVPVGGVAPPQPAPQQPPKSNKKFDEYSKLLKKWKESEYSNEKVNAIYEYTQKGSIVQDLIDSNIIYKAADKNLKLSGDKFDVKKLLIRWRVNIKNGLQYETWKDETIRESWINFMKSQKSEKKKGM